MISKQTPDILKKIVDKKIEEVTLLKSTMPIPELERRIANQSPTLNLSGALMNESIDIIAEVKKSSPAKGLLRSNFDPVSLATMYAENGASAISVLTEVKHFQGDISHLEAVSNIAHKHSIPVIRKDFIFDSYQVCEARAFGADAILLIVAMLSPKTLSTLIKFAQNYWLQCLVEVHEENELKIAIDAGAEIIGINNRDLHTFKTDLSITKILAPSVPKNKTIVSESGISSRDHVKYVQKAGAHAALVGESLVISDDPGQKLRELM